MSAEGLAWAPCDVLVATVDGPRYATGAAFQGVLGVVPLSDRRALIIHLGSGHMLASVWGAPAHARACVEEIARLGDWDFDDPVEGYLNRDPELLDRFETWLASAASRGVYPQLSVEGDRAQAREIARLRA